MIEAAGARITDESPLAVVCGGGSLPFAVADAVVKRGRGVVLFGNRGCADPQRVAAYPHYWTSLGQFGSLCRLARREGCRDVVFIGSVMRPSVWGIRPDFKTLRMLPRIVAYLPQRRRPSAEQHRKAVRGAGLPCARCPRDRAADIDAERTARWVETTRRRPC